MLPARWLDCGLLDPSASCRLSDADLRRMEPLHRTLMSPLDHGSVDGWRAAVNRKLMEAFDSDMALFQLDHDGVALQFSEEFEPVHLGVYTDGLMAELARAKQLYDRTVELGAGNRSILWNADLGWLYGSAYYNGLVRKMRAFDPLWAAVSMEGTEYPAIIHTYHDRRRASRYFGAREVALMRSVRPALEAGVRALTRTAANRISLSASLDGQRDGALVYDMDGGLLHRNPGVARAARTRRAERELVEAGRQMALGIASRDLLASLASRNASRTVSTPSGTHRLHAVRLGEGVFALRPTVMVTLAAGSPPLPDRTTLRRRFDLTPRQAEVTLLLVRRKTTPEIAEELSISPHTARHHVHAAMRKLGVSDRREVEGVVRRAGE